MNTNRKTAITFGVLIILGIVFGIFSSVPALEQPDYLMKLSSIKMQVLIAVFCQFMMAAVYVCIAVLLYPIIKKYNEKLALGYFGFRMIGAAILFIGIASLLLLLFISERFVIEGQPSSSYFQTMGELLRVGRDLMNHIVMILPWSLGGLILYFCFFQMKLIPKWLSVWGMIGSILTLIATLLLMFDLIKIVTPIYFIMNTPTAIFELVLAVYLMIKSFNPIVDDSNDT
ncbi:DUF4386 domain-containing protein [Bacillus sp. CLL-7-23]|uniref:DUF4386 domain-containing protein n=1 Tax=Bacillus changyiensis TaxID=3004103 RepID=A0ABT4X9A0_9BACI|nr:DUF4386 domain-containing protein [Bacillus changyiensis]MDA7028319.1 DUF4386 domain-containing protein [Bacillus changyiensis]